MATTTSETREDRARTQILDHGEITQKIKRIAYQIYESHYGLDEITVVAVADKGVLLADRLVPVLESIGELRVRRLKLKVDKKTPLKDPALDGEMESLDGRSVILLDDVLNSGRTLMYAARHILTSPIARLTTVVLVDRRHRKFPIKADFVGLTLSTTLQDHIEVEFGSERDAAYLVE